MSLLDTLNADVTAITNAAAQSYIGRRLLPAPAGAVPPPVSSSAPAATSAASTPAGRPAAGVSLLGSGTMIVLGLVLIVGAFVALRAR